MLVYRPFKFHDKYILSSAQLKEIQTILEYNIILEKYILFYTFDSYLHLLNIHRQKISQNMEMVKLMFFHFLNT